MATEGLDKRQREEEKLECIIFSITLPAMIATTLAIKKFENSGVRGNRVDHSDVGFLL